jgi:hypothetical protein
MINTLGRYHHIGKGFFRKEQIMNSPFGRAANSGYTVIMAFLISILLHGLSFGFGFIDALDLGTPLNCLSPRCLALGGPRTVGLDSPYSVFLNPARIPADNSSEVSLGMIYGGWKETVSVAGGVITRGEDIPFSPYGAASLRLTEDLALGAGYSLVSVFDYKGANLITEDPVNPDEVTETQHLISDGNLYEALCGISWSFSDDFSMGMSGGFRFGSADIQETDYVYLTDTTIITVHDWSWDENQFCWHGGIKADFDFGTAGVTYTSPTDHYPTRVALGAIVLAEHLKNTRVGFEIESVSPGADAEYIGKFMVENPTATFLNTMLGVSFTDGSRCNRPSLGFAIGFEMNFPTTTVQLTYSHKARNRLSPPGNEQSYHDYDDALTILSVALTYYL